MKLGFTGSRKGLTAQQAETLKHLFLTIPGIEEFHHGDCIGADADAHELIKNNLIVKAVIHPPINSKNRAWCFDPERDFMMPIKDYLERNVTIVNSSDRVIATPGESTEQLRSGTWSTIRYALIVKKPIDIILPNGEIINQLEQKRYENRKGVRNGY